MTVAERLVVGRNGRIKANLSRVWLPFESDRLGADARLLCRCADPGRAGWRAPGAPQSERSASTGSSRLARQAGYMPKHRPMADENPIPNTTLQLSI